VSDSFFSRWSRQKNLNRELTQAREAAVPKVADVPQADLTPRQTAVPLAPVAKPQQHNAAGLADVPPDLPTQADVDALAVGADVSRFLQTGVAEAVRGAALKKLFADPAYNVISDMDDYVEDYSQMVKLSATELRQLRQSKDLHLFEDPPWKVEANARDAAAKQAAEEKAAQGETTQDAAFQQTDADAIGTDGEVDPHHGADAVTKDAAATPTPEMKTHL
jgi:hypothetical protein